MIDARGDGSFDALQPPGDRVKHVSCACKPTEPSKSPARRAAQQHEGRVFVCLQLCKCFKYGACVCLQRRARPAAFQRGTRDAMQALPSLLPAGPTQRQSKARRGEERVSRPKKKNDEKKKAETGTKGPSGDHPSCSTTIPPPQQQPKEAIEDNPRAVIGERDSTARRRLQRH